MSIDKQHAINVLSFWQQTEFFNTIELKSLMPGNDAVLQFTTADLSKNPQSLPWFNRQVLCSAGDDYYPANQYSYTLYLGLFNRAEIYEQSKDIITGTQNNEDWEQRRQDDGISCCAKIKLNQDAELQIESLEMSTAPWALGKLLAGKIDQLNMDDFEEDVQKFKDRWQQIHALASNVKKETQASSAFTSFELFEVLKLLANWAGFKPRQTRFALIVQLKREYNDNSPVADLLLHEQTINQLKQLPYLVKNLELNEVEHSQQETNSQLVTADDNDIPILNSFFVDDITKAIRLFKEDKLSARSPLVQFLSAKYTRRADLLTPEGEAIVVEKLAINNTPYGRWPSSEQQSMSLMQQFAINTLEQTLVDGGLYSVNGPPGTGKTTMLRDIIAANIVKRAQVLASLKSAKAAFAKTQKIKIADDMVDVQQLIPSLCGYEMLVVSSNNTAVENITKELPQAKVLGQAFQELNYFKPVAQKVAAQVIKKKKSKTLIGLSEQDDCWGLIAAALGNSGNRKRFASKLFFEKPSSMTCDDVSSAYRTLVEAIKELAGNDTSEDIFAQAQTAFKQAEKAVGSALSDLHRLESLAARQRKLAAMYIELLRSKSDYQKSFARLLKLQRRCLPWWSFSILKACNHRAIIQAYSGRVITRKSVFEVKQSEHQLFSAMLEQEVKECESISQIHSDAVFYQIDSNLDDADIQRKAFSHSTQLNLLRSELSARAFELHQAWLVASYNSGFAQTLNKLPDLLQDKISAPADAKLMWQCFFMVVPVVSSAFASVANQFAKLGQDDIGWLFIDEAGQATPQQAVGALFRAKRAIVVGDPLQIEPVFTAPPKVVENFGRRILGDEWDVWSPSVTSVQELADRINPFGTELISRGKWLGSPLRVHRRCSDPMFSISNEIAYNNKMLHGSNDIAESATFVWGPSQWFDVQGEEEGKHYVPEQAVHVLHMLYNYVSAEHGLPDCYIISPFTKVKSGLSKYLKSEFKHPLVNNVEFSEWIKGRVGTVHTFQGKEEKFVIFVLGASQNNGAANWAASKPNLLNVALTRAKNRVYIIGCRETWAGLAHFSEAYMRLATNQQEQME